MEEAKKYNVFPLDNQQVQRAIAPRPSLTAGRTVFTYSGEASGPLGNAPSILKKSYTITADLDVPEGGGKDGRHGGGVASAGSVCT